MKAKNAAGSATKRSQLNRAQTNKSSDAKDVTDKTKLGKFQLDSLDTALLILTAKRTPKPWANRTRGRSSGVQQFLKWANEGNKTE